MAFLTKLGANPWADYRQVVTLVVCLFGQLHAAAAVPPGKNRYPLNTRLDGPLTRSGRVRKIMPPLRFDPPTAQSVANLCTDWAVLADVLIRFQT